MGNDSANAFANSGVVNVFSAVDLVAMDAIGWDLAGSVAPPAAPPAPPPPPTGVTISASDKTLAGALTGAVPIATLTQTGGTSGDTFAYQLGGAGAGAFTVSTSANIGTLRSGAGGLAGSLIGTVYALTVTATGTTYNQSSHAVPLDVIAGSTDSDTISIATLSAHLGLDTPTFVYGGQGSDTLVGSEMTGRLWLTGGADGDQMTSGGGVDIYVYGSTSDSTSSAMDVITNFSAASDRIDLSGLGIALQYAGAIPSNGKGAKVNVLGAHSVGWQVSGGNTFVYVNTSGSKENLSATNMKIELAGSVSLNGENIMHV